MIVDKVGNQSISIYTSAMKLACCAHISFASALLAELSFLAAASLHAKVVVNNFDAPNNNNNNFDAHSCGSGARMSLW